MRDDVSFALFYNKHHPAMKTQDPNSHLISRTSNIALPLLEGAPFIQNLDRGEVVVIPALAVGKFVCIGLVDRYDLERRFHLF